jgi:hypothetical protein
MTEPAFIAAVLKNDFNRGILERLANVDAPDAWLVSGAVFQTVWNIATGREPTFGIKDYDIFYFDRDTCWEAEDAVIQQTARIFGDLGAHIEIRNQARVHLWYPEKFGMPYPPATRATDGIDRFLIVCAQIGIRRRSSAYDVYAPRGIDDIERMIVRPNLTANFRADRYFEKAARWKSVWPELTILPAETGERA